MPQQQSELSRTAEFIESLDCPVDARVGTTCRLLKLAESPEEELFGRPVEVAVDHRLELARELARVTGYRWGRWRSSSGETKLHLIGEPDAEGDVFDTACGNIVHRPYCESLIFIDDGDRCKRCMAVDAEAFAADVRRRKTELAISEAAWWRRTRPYQSPRQPSRATMGRDLSISLQNMQGETIRLEPRPYEINYRRREVATFVSDAPDQPEEDDQDWFARAREAFAAVTAAVFGVPRELIETERQRANLHYNHVTATRLEEITRAREAEFQRDVDMISIPLESHMLFPWEYDYRLDQMARAACRILGIAPADTDLATIDGKMTLIQGARRHVAAYGRSYRVPDAWCMGARWRPLTGGLNAPPRPRFRDMVGE